MTIGVSLYTVVFSYLPALKYKSTIVNVVVYLVVYLSQLVLNKKSAVVTTYPTILCLNLLWVSDLLFFKATTITFCSNCIWRE